MSSVETNCRCFARTPVRPDCWLPGQWIKEWEKSFFELSDRANRLMVRENWQSDETTVSIKPRVIMQHANVTVYNFASHTSSSSYLKVINEAVKKVKNLKAINKLVKWWRSSDLHFKSQERLPAKYLSRWRNLAEHSSRVQVADFSEAGVYPTVFGCVLTIIASESVWISRRCSSTHFVSTCSYFYLFLYFLESVFDFILLWFLIGLQLLINHVKFLQNLILRVFFHTPPPTTPSHEPSEAIRRRLNCYSNYSDK